MRHAARFQRALAPRQIARLSRRFARARGFNRLGDNLAAYRQARDRFFATVTPPAAPAVTLIEVSRLYGPDFLIEIEAVAAI